MKDFDRVGSSDNFNFRGVPSFLQVCEKRFQATRKTISLNCFVKYRSLFSFKNISLIGVCS